MHPFFNIDKTNSNTKHSIPGLSLINKFITKQQQKQLITKILQQQWNTSLKRRTQHYGYQYIYDRKSVAVKVEQIPQWCLFLKQRIQHTLNTNINTNSGLKQCDIQQNKQRVIFDQMIINQYQPGQGINPHIDNTELFMDTIVSVSLSSQTTMVFQRVVASMSNSNNSKKQQQYTKQKQKQHKFPQSNSSNSSNNSNSNSNNNSNSNSNNNSSNNSSNKQDSSRVQLILQRRSIVILQGQCRYNYKHSIPARKKDNGKERGMRYSLTFRRMSNIVKA